MLTKPLRFLEIILLAVFFSTSFLFNKTALQDIHPITLVALRVGIGGCLLLLLLKLRGISIPMQFKVWKYSFIVGFFLNGLPFVLFCYSLNLIPTSLSALLNGVTPIVTVLLSNLFLHDEKINLERFLGISFGILGFLILFLPSILTQGEFNLWGMSLSFLGGCLYAIGAVYARRNLFQTQPLVVPTLQLLTSLIYLVPCALMLEPSSNLLSLGKETWMAVFGLALIPTFLAFILYHRIIVQYGATYVVMCVYLLPIFATILGVVFLNETLSINFIIAGIVIMIGLGIVNGMIPINLLRMRKSIKVAQAES